MSKDRKIRILGDSESSIMPESRAIQKTFDDMSDAQIRTCRMVYENGILIVSFSTGPDAPDDVCYVLRMAEGSGWTEEDGLICRDMKALKNPVTSAMDFCYVSGGGDLYTMFTGTDDRYFHWISSEVGYTNETGGPIEYMDSQAGVLYIGGSLSGVSLAGFTTLLQTAKRDEVSFITSSPPVSSLVSPVIDLRVYPDHIGRWHRFSIFGNRRVVLRRCSLELAPHRDGGR